MAEKLPPDAIEFYVSLGADRSYEAVAQHYGVSKRTVASRAIDDDWQRRVRVMEAKAKAAAEKRATESLEEMHERHLKSVRVIQARALEALRTLTIDSAFDAVRALDIGIRQERILRGEPSDGAKVSIVIGSSKERSDPGVE